MSEPAVLPNSPFWRFSLDLYARPGVAASCIALQDREGIDVNLLLLALWLGTCGHRLTPERGSQLLRIARHWQRPIVRPLRQARRRLKRRSAAAHLPWPQAVEHWRRRLAEVELALEHVEQLLLEQSVGPVDIGAPDGTVARDNLRTLGLAPVEATHELSQLMELCFLTDIAP